MKESKPIQFGPQLTNRICHIAPIQPALRRDLPDYQERVLPWNEVSQKRNALFYTFHTAPGTEPVEVPVIPDACADMLICCDPQAPSLTVCHRRMEPGTLSLRPGARYFGFKPFSTKGMLLDLDESSLPWLDRCMRKQQLFSQLCAADSFEWQITLFVTFARQNLIDYSYHPDLVEMAEILICATNGNIRVDELGRELSYSPRYCRERFSRDHGASMKTTCDILRFQNLLRLMESNRFATDSELACSAGYFDQPHMIRDFRKFSGVTPRKFRQQYIPAVKG